MEKPHALKGRKQSPEHVAKKARKCEPGCACKRHTSQKAPEVREKHRQNVRREWEAGTYEGRKEKNQATWASKTPEEMAEHRRNWSEGKKREWAKARSEGRRRNRHYGTRKRTSNHELALVPYMAALGFSHGTGRRIGHKVPDFVNEDAKAIYEYFGTYWHPDRDEERRLKEFYAARGWTCQVIWEDDLFSWLSDHAHLVTDAEHEQAWKVAHINNGYRKPS